MYRVHLHSSIHRSASFLTLGVSTVFFFHIWCMAPCLYRISQYWPVCFLITTAAETDAVSRTSLLEYLQEDLILKWLFQLSLALQQIHANQTIHRNICVRFPDFVYGLFVYMHCVPWCEQIFHGFAANVLSFALTFTFACVCSWVRSRSSRKHSDQSG